MLRPPIILPIVPSKYWLLVQTILLLGLAMLSYWLAGALALLATMTLGGLLGWRAYRCQPCGELHILVAVLPYEARWVLSKEQPSEGRVAALNAAHQVRCDYLGPWLIGLYVGKQRVWLWPDSAPMESLREVRALFHRPGR